MEKVNNSSMSNITSVPVQPMHSKLKLAALLAFIALVACVGINIAIKSL